MNCVAQASNSVPLEAVAITAGAVVLAALIAAWAAHKRLQSTLTAERERARDQLDAESERLGRQLEHDRELSDLAELRTLLDGVMADVLAAYNAYLKLIHDCRGELAASPAKSEEEARERRVERLRKRLAYNEADQTLNVDWLRLSARLPPGHEVVKAYDDVTRAAEGSPAPDDPLTPGGVDAMEASAREMWTAQGELIAACRTVIAFRVPHRARGPS